MILKTIEVWKDAQPSLYAKINAAWQQAEVADEGEVGNYDDNVFVVEVASDLDDGIQVWAEPVCVNEFGSRYGNGYRNISGTDVADLLPYE